MKMEKKDAVFFVLGIIENHVDVASEEEVLALAKEIVERMENIEIYEKSEELDSWEPDNEEYEE